MSECHLSLVIRRGDRRLKIENNYRQCYVTNHFEINGNRNGRIMKHLFLCLLSAFFLSGLNADDDLMNLDRFIQQIEGNKIFVFPITRQETMPAYSLISLVLKDDSRKQKPLAEIPERTINKFIEWTGVIIKKPYCNENMAEEMIALPDVVLYENKTHDNRHVFTWISDILLVRNQRQEESYSWDTGTFFALYLKTHDSQLENDDQVKTHIETLLSRYTNFFQNDQPSYTCEAVKKNGIWRGTYSLPQQNSHSWRKFTEFVAGKNFTCFFFAEIADGEEPSPRARPGDVNRF